MPEHSGIDARKRQKDGDVPSQGNHGAFDQRPSPVSLVALFVTFLRLGALSFGGGLSGWLYREIVEGKRWMGEEEFLAGLAINQILPGTNITNMTVHVGSRLRGLAGATAALIGLLFVPFFSVIVLLMLYGRLAGNNWIQASLEGSAAAALGLMMLLGWKAGRRVTRSTAGVIIMGFTFVAVGILQLPLVPVALFLAPISIAVAWRQA